MRFETCKINKNCNIKNLDFVPRKIYTIDSRVCRNGWIAEYQIGEKSTSGVIYRTCCQQHCGNKNVRYVMKQVNFGVQTHQISSEENLIREAEFQIRAAEYGIAPKIYQIIIGDNQGILIMDMLKGSSLRKQIEKILLSEKSHSNKKKIIHNYMNTAKNLIHSLHEIGIFHGDTHLNNFMIESTNVADWGDMKVIDFGLSENINNVGNIKNVKKSEDFSQMYSDLGVLKHQLQENYRLSNEDLSILDGEQEKVYQLINSLILDEKSYKRDEEILLDDIEELRMSIKDARETDMFDDDEAEKSRSILLSLITRYYKLGRDEEEIKKLLLKLVQFMNKYYKNLDEYEYQIDFQFGRKTRKIRKSRKVSRKIRKSRKTKKSRKASRKIRKSKKIRKSRK